MNTQTTTFKKTVTIEGRSAEALIEVTEGFNRKNQPFRNVNFINTRPIASYEAASKFENGEIELAAFIRVLNADGFTN